MVQERFAAEQNKGRLSYKVRDKREERDRHKKWKKKIYGECLLPMFKSERKECTWESTSQ
jgi:hypothetical protein